MNAGDTVDEIHKKQYKLLPPEGGWGNILTVALAVMLIVTVVPLSGFGIIYGKYLRQISDESSATSTLVCIFNTVLNFMGLVANHLLKTNSYRYIGIIGSISFFLGNFLSIFATSIWQLIITFGILQGVGFGLLITAMFSSFNEYFIERKNFMMGVSQTILGAVAMIVPYFARILMDEYGYRGTVAILAALSLNAFAAALTLQPVEWHMIKVPLPAIEMTFLGIENDKSKHTDIGNIESIPEISNAKENNANKNKILDFITNFLELSILKDPIFVNICLGLSFAFMSDIMFISLLPMFVYHLDYNHEETAYVITIHMAADLLGRLILSGYSAAVKVNNRNLFLYASAATAVIRIIFTIYSGPWLLTIALVALLGMLRSVIQVTVPLVLAEYTQTKFTAAYGLYLAVCGLVSLASGQLSSLVALYTTGDTWVQHLLTLQNLLCFFPWIIEMVFHNTK